MTEILSEDEKRRIAEGFGAGEVERRSYRQKSWEMTEPEPDAAAESLRLGQVFGVPRQAVDADPEYWRKRDEEARRRLRESVSPKTMAWVDHPDNYALAKDDVENLSLVERAFKEVTDVGRSLVSAAPSTLGGAISGFGEYYDSAVRFNRRHVIGNIPVVSDFADRADAAEAAFWARHPEASKIVAGATPGGALKSFGRSFKATAEAWRPEDMGIEDKIAEGIGQIITAVGVTLATGNPAVAGAGFAGLGADQQAESLRAAGIDPADRLGELSAGAAITGGSEMLRLGSIMRVLPASVRNRVAGSVVSRIVGQATEEGVQEVIEGLAHNLVTMTYDADATPLAGLAEQGGLAAASAGIFQAGVEALIPGRTRSMSRTLEAVAKELDASIETPAEAALAQAFDLAAASKLRGRSPQKFAEYVDSLGVGDVTIDLDAVSAALVESGADPVEVLSQLGVSEAEIDRLSEVSGEVTVPASRLLASSLITDHRNALQPHVRPAEESLTPAQKKTAREGLRAEIEREVVAIRKAVEEGSERTEKERAVYDVVLARIEGAGALRREQAAASASIHTAMITTLARRIGVDPVELFEKHYPRIQGNIDGMISEADRERVTGGQPEGQTLASSRPWQPAIISEAATDAEEALNDLLNDFDQIEKEALEEVEDAISERVSEIEEEYQAKIDFWEREVDPFLVGENAYEAYTEPLFDALDPDSSTYDDDTWAIHLDGLRVEREAIDAKEDEIMANVEALEAERDRFIETEYIRVEDEATRQFEEFRRQTITEMFDEFERVYGTAALLDAYESYGDFDTRERMMLDKDNNQIVSLRDMIARRGKPLAQLGSRGSKIRQEKRGAYSPVSNVVTLFEAADVTTLMHEGAHWYFEMLNEMASSPDPHPFIIEQIEAVKTWGGVGPDFQMYGADGRLTDDAVALHEKFAETFEAYLQTGKAPTASLREVFRTFSEWITSLWKRMYGGGQPARANLSDDIVAVMNRMVAIDDEMEAIREETVPRAVELATALREKGVLTEKQYEKALANLDEALKSAKEDMTIAIMAAVNRKNEAWYAKERARVKNDVLREFDRSLVGRAYSWLGFGQWKGDVPASERQSERASEQQFFQGAPRERLPYLRTALDDFVGALGAFDEALGPDPRNPQYDALASALRDALAPVGQRRSDRRATVEALTRRVEESAPDSPLAIALLELESAVATRNESAALATVADALAADSALPGDLREAIEDLASDPEADAAAIELAAAQSRRVIEDWSRSMRGAPIDTTEAAAARDLLNQFDATLRDVSREGNELFQSAPVFYSALHRFVTSNQTARAPAAQWKGMISNAPGIKAGEVEWTGVLDWLDLQEGPVTRETLAAFVEANGVQVEEKMKAAGGADQPPNIENLARQMFDESWDDPNNWDEWMYETRSERAEQLFRQQPQSVQEYFANGYDWAEFTFGGRYLDENLFSNEEIALIREDAWSDVRWDFEEAAQWRVDDERHDGGMQGEGDTKWMAHTLPGGENYREMLLTLPKGKGFKSSHWSELNVLAHVRFKERTGPNGERVLALEEIQSDWHQAGREMGYKENKFFVLANGYQNYGEFKTRAEAEAYIKEYIAPSSQSEMSIREGEIGGVPQAPFKNNAWTELVLKRMIRYAAENGFDSVAWIPGNIQNGRVVETDDNRGDFYDKIVPNIANKLGKKFGAKVHKIAELAKNVDFWSLPLTPELAAVAMTEGFPLFQRGDPAGWGETAPPPELPPMRLNLEAVKDLHPTFDFRKLPKEIVDRSRNLSSTDTLVDIARATAKTLRRRPPKTLLQFIRTRKARTSMGRTLPLKEWGIKGAADELRAMDRADLINEKTGIPIDTVREMADEAGYIPGIQTGQDSLITDLLDAIDREARGEPVYSVLDMNEVIERESAETWADWFDENGVDIYTKDPKALRVAIAKVAQGVGADVVTPDQAAGPLGFETGEQLLEALAAAGNREKFISAETDRRMAEEFGDPFTDGTFAEEARRAAENEVHIRQAELELEALARAVGVTAASKLAKDTAANALSLMTVKELSNWERFLDIERRETRNALAAAQKGDVVATMMHKRRQLVNAHLAKAARERSEQIEKSRKDLVTYLTNKHRRAKIAPDYIDRIEAVLESYELRMSKQGPGEQRRRLSAKEYVDEMIAAGREDEIAPEARLLAESADKKTWRNLTVDEVEYLVGTVKNIAHLGRTKHRLLTAAEKRRFDAVIDELVDTLSAAGPLPGAQREYSFRPTAGEKISRFGRTSHAWLMRMEHQLRALDGRANGPLWNALFRVFADAADVESQMQRETAKEVREAYAIYSPTERYAMHHVAITAPELGRPVGKRWTKMEVISIALNWGVQYNRDALIAGYANRGWTEEGVQAVLDRLMTDKDWNFVERVWSISGKYKAEAFALEKAMTGVEPKAVEGISFQTGSGRTIDGKYYHIEYDSRQLGAKSRRQQKQDEKEALSDRMRSLTKAQTKNGGLIARVGSGGKPVRLSISVFDGAMADTIHDIAYRRAVNDAGRIINDARFADAYEIAAGKESYDQLRPWLESIVKSPSDVATGGAALLVMMRRNLPIAYMGYKVGTAVIQTTGILAGVPEVGLKWVAQGLAKATVGNPMSIFGAWRAVSEKSEFMRDRPMGYDRDVREITTQMGEGSPLGAMKRNAFIMISAFDLAVSTPLWIGAYDKAMAGKVAGIDVANEEDAIAYADSVIRRTQTAGRMQDLARISRDSEFSKSLTMLYGYFSNLYSYTSQQVRAVRTGEINPVQFASYMMILFVAIPVLVELLAGRLIPGDDEDDDETIYEKMGKAVISNFAGMFPVIRDMVNYRLEPQYGYKLSPVASGAKDVLDAAAAPFDGEMTEAEYRKSVRAMGALFGLPSSQAVITGDYIVDLLGGAEEPLDDPLDAAREALLRDTR